jgi:molecular chaperone DnaK
LLDVTPLSLGLETLGGVFTKLIERNTTIPTTKSQVFSTAEDNQSAVTIRVFQGERQMAADNKMLGQFNLEGIAPAPRGMPQIEVTFDIDANGIVNVSAKDKATNKEQKITIQASGGLNEADIDKMVKDAEKFASEDKARKEKIEVRNNADSLTYSVEKSLKEHGDKVDAATKEKIEQDLKVLKEAIEADDTERMKQASETLTQSSMAIGQAIYQQQQSEATAGAASAEQESNSSDDEKVVDADYKETKKDE